MKVARNFKVLVCDTGEVLGHQDLHYILDIIVEDHGVPLETLLDRVCIIEIQDLEGYSGSTFPIRRQMELIEEYIRGK